MLDHFSRVTGRKKPICLPIGVMKPLAHATTWFKHTFMPGASHRFTPMAVYIVETRRHADTKRAQDELGFEPGDMGQAIEEAYDFFVGQGAIQPRGQA